MPDQTRQPADRKLTHRTRNNTAAIMGLADAIYAHAMNIRIAINNGDETKLQSTLADLGMDYRCIESAIVAEEQ